jgi:hypothetical protein
MKMNLKNIKVLCAVLTLSVALSFVTVACSSSSPATPSSTITTMTTATTSTTDVSTTTSITTTAQRPGANGTITAINGDTLTLTTRSGQVTVIIIPTTSIEETVTGTIVDLNQGDYVTISGAADSTGDIDATSIMLRQAQAGQSFPTTGTTSGFGGSGEGFTGPGGGTLGSGSGGQFTVGTISSVNGNSITVMTSQAQVTVNIGTNTTILKTVNGAVSDLSVGDSLSVMGTIDNSGDIDATFISVRPQGQGIPGASPTTTS